MIVLDHCKSPRLLKHEILNLRIQKDHPKWPIINANYKRLKAGYEGEKSIDFYLDVLEDSKYFIFHGLRIKYKNYYFQMDTLIISAKFILILEMKNVAEDLIFDNFGQVTNRQKKRMKNPVAQVKMQAVKLKKWLEDQGYYDIPIHYLFVNGNEHSKIISQNELLNRNMCNSEFLYDKLEQIIKFYQEDKLENKDIKKLNRLLLASHTPDNPDVMKLYKLSTKDISTGVACPHCDFFPIIYIKGKWFCPKCKEKSKDAHLKAINDYFILIKSSFTNYEIRTFLRIDSIHAMQKILLSIQLPHTGSFKNRIYHQPPTPITSLTKVK